ncbi:hypothetical protein LRP88_01267 [Fusarium phalaenopsidis]
MLRTRTILPALIKGTRSFATVSSTSQLGVVQPSIKEINNMSLDSRNLEKAVRHMHRDGLVVVEDVVPHEHLDLLNKKMAEDANTLLARDPIATQITTAMMGPRPKWTFCSANSAMATLPGGSPQRQPVHSDADFAHPDHPFALVVNVPLVTATPENGSTEIWLGTHNNFGLDAQEGAHGDRASGRIREDLLRQREKISPPLQPIIKKRMRLEFGQDIKPILEKLEGEGKLGLDVPVDWVSREAVLEGYLNRGFGNSYDFDQEP